MIVGIKDLKKLIAISIVAACAVFVCTLFLNYNIDIVSIKDEIATPQGEIVYEAQKLAGKMISGVSGGCLILTSIVMLLFYIKNFVDSRSKELGILKALGYSEINVALRFWIFGLSVLAGTIIGYIAASCYMPHFYKIQNNEGLLPDITPHFHGEIAACLIVLPTLLFALLSVVYAYIKLKRPALDLLRQVQKYKVKIRKDEYKDNDFLTDLKKNTLRGRKIFAFFVAFSAFCFSAMTQMSMSMKQLSSESFSFMIITIGLTLAFISILLSLSSVLKANAKSIAMMKVFGYTRKECSRALIGVYRPVSYIGFVIGTAYQYGILKMMMTLVYADYENIPEYHFDFKALVISLAAFVVLYELIIYLYSKKIEKVSVKSIMLE